MTGQDYRIWMFNETAFNKVSRVFLSEHTYHLYDLRVYSIVEKVIFVPGTKCVVDVRGNFMDWRFSDAINIAWIITELFDLSKIIQYLQV